MGRFHIFCVCKPGQKYFQQTFGQFNSGPRLSAMATDTTRHSQRGRDVPHEIPCDSASGGIFGGEWLVMVTSLPRPQSRKRCRVTTLGFVKTTSNWECKESTKCCGFCGRLFVNFYRAKKNNSDLSASYQRWVLLMGRVGCFPLRKFLFPNNFTVSTRFQLYWHRHIVCLALNLHTPSIKHAISPTFCAQVVSSTLNQMFVR